MTTTPLMAQYEYKIERPTAEHVAGRQATFAADRSFFGVDSALNQLFAAFPDNRSFDAVLTKAACLDRLYSTNVYAIVAMSDHILSLAVDDDLEAGRSCVVEKIATLTLDGKTRRHYSFATKYCSFSQPSRYHIFDNQVCWLLTAYRKRFAFADFAKDDLCDYDEFAKAMAAFVRYFGLERLSKKELDKFLWIEASEIWRTAKPTTP